MKKNLSKAARAVLLAALGLTGVTVAQAQINNNDLVLGFTSPNAASIGGSQYDYVIDLGQLLGASPQQITLSAGQYNDSTFTTDLGGAVTGGSAYVGVFGGTGGSSANVLLSAFGQPSTGTVTEYQQAAGHALGVSLGAVAQISSSSVYGDISKAPGQSGNDANSFALYVPSPLETISSAQGTGQSAINLEVWQATVTTGLHPTANPYTDQGFVSILFTANGGIAGVAWDETATPVPEPTTCGIFAGVSLLLLGLRRQLTGKIA